MGEEGETRLGAITKLPSRQWHTSAIWSMCGDDLAFGEPSWLASLCSLKLARRPSTLPLPFLWANLTPLRPFPIVKTGRAGSLEVISVAASGLFLWERRAWRQLRSKAALRRGRRSWRGVRQLLNKRSCLVGASVFCAGAC